MSYTRLSAYQLAVLHGIYPKPHPCRDSGIPVWVGGGPILFGSTDDVAIFYCRCGVYGFVTRSKIEDILDPKCTMRPWVKEQRDQ